MTRHVVEFLDMIERQSNALEGATENEQTTLKQAHYASMSAAAPGPSYMPESSASPLHPQIRNLEPNGVPQSPDDRLLFASLPKL